MRIGIDVGGTNTDAVLMDGDQVVRTVKTPTTAEVSQGIICALRELADETAPGTDAVDAVMIGTTHFTNAAVQGQRLEKTACIRLGLPATATLAPMVDWPEALRETIASCTSLVHGGFEFDGREISPLDEAEITRAAEAIAEAGVSAVAISSVFSPVNDAHETRAAEIVARVVGSAAITLSSSIGRLGLLERENAAILNASLSTLARTTVQGFQTALEAAGLKAPLYITQNDGTLMNADFAARYPVLTFASGATNSMRGAAFLTGLDEAIVVDVGGTTTDIGVVHNGFPRVAGQTESIAGVRTNFRMPDTHSIGLGGGSRITADPLSVGPDSVGYELTREALVFGGDTLTATDIAVASGRLELGDSQRVRHLDPKLIAAVQDRIALTLDRAIDRVRTSAEAVPVIVVGGGSILVGEDLAAASEVIKPEHYSVANAIGAAIAQVGGVCDRVFSLAEMSRAEALEKARAEAVRRAVAAGADRESVDFVDIDEVGLAYLPGNATRITVRAVGELAGPAV